MPYAWTHQPKLDAFAYSKEPMNRGIRSYSFHHWGFRLDASDQVLAAWGTECQGFS